MNLDYQISTAPSQDSGVIIIDHAIGTTRRKEFDALALTGKIQFRDSLRMMWESVNMTWDEALKMLEGNLTMFVIQHCHLLEPHRIDFSKHFALVANKVTVEGTKWNIHFQDDSPYGHDKSRAMKSAKEANASSYPHPPTPPPVYVFIGDGVSDVSAAKEADMLFAKKGKDLEKYCVTHSIPHVTFETFDEVVEALKATCDV
ncbi:hypothetical protein HDU93_000991 [Gonapodya sp. JEL0774]|nr:hypothetical protein HDU93_000991 [Gonapodya sp. JEL0774]